MDNNEIVYDREELLKIATDAVNESELKSTEIPAIDLYVDQIINLVTEKLSHGSERYHERHLTKTMINNYSKDGLITPHKEGMTAIYAKIESSVAVCMVTVIDPARMITFTTPEMPMQLDCIDPLSGKKTSFIIKGYSFDHILDYREGDGNFVRVTMKFEVEKTFDEEGADGINTVAFNINLYEAGFAGMLETVTRGETKIKVGETCTVEYVFGARFHEGRRNFKVEILPITEQK